MEFSKDELYTLSMVLKTEIDETKDSIKTVSGNDKKELEEYLAKLESIYNKINK